jgi:epoxyqueuosine reductase
MSALRESIQERARALGFDAVGIARADVPLGPEFERYVDFVRAGRHGAMGYLAAEPEARRRLDSEAILPGAKSVICLARRYARTPEDEASDPPLARRVARYARGQDYHNFLRKKVRALAAFVRTLGPEVRARPLCDEEPLLERAWAARAGIGFVGKNGLVIIPGQGSFVLLGEVVTTLAIEPDQPIAERCGSCTLCLDACPTQAFDAPFVLDPRRCVAYLTIEDTAGDRAGVTEHLFGCDACQSVCPFNKTRAPAAPKTRPFRPLPVWEGLGLADLLRLDEPGFLALTTGSPLRRATRSGLARSAARLAQAEAAAGRATDDVREALALGLAHDDDIVREIARGPSDRER